MENSNDSVTDMGLATLKRILKLVEQNTKQLDQHTELLEQHSKQLTRLGARMDQTVTRLDQTNARLDKLVENTGKHWRDHERRITRLEDRIPGRRRRTKSPH